jgi:signal transduction histidine kinase
MGALYLRACVLPVAVIAVLSGGVVTFVLVRGASTAVIRLLLAGAGAAIAVMLIATIYAASAATRHVYREVQSVRSLAVHGKAQLQQLVGRVLSDEQPISRIKAPAHAAQSDPFRLLAYDLEQSQYAAEQAVLRVAARAPGGTADRVPGGTADQRVEIFVNLARRMQSLVHREIELLDDLEAKVEDPELLKGLFTVDHLATRMRRQSESLAVVGGAASRRQWTRQVTMHEVLRAAVAEVEEYSRVKVVPPVEGILFGNAVSDVIHLIAELIENATKFSAPRTHTLLRAQKVTAGLAIDVEDRGLGMMAADQQRMNNLLADPSRVDIGELLRDGRIGLFVVSTLARRHGIKVQLQTNIYGGTQAVVVLPNSLVDPEDRERDAERPRPAGETKSEPGPVAAMRVSPSSLPSPPPAWQVSLPARSAGAADWGDAVQTGVTPAAAPPPATTFPAPPAADLGEGPPLPRRQAQAHLAPQLRGAPAARRDEPTADQMIGLMANFQKGVSRSEEEDSPARD